MRTTKFRLAMVGVAAASALALAACGSSSSSESSATPSTAMSSTMASPSASDAASAQDIVGVARELATDSGAELGGREPVGNPDHSAVSVLRGGLQA